jgi:hypothetical protein
MIGGCRTRDLRVRAGSRRATCLCGALVVGAQRRSDGKPYPLENRRLAGASTSTALSHAEWDKAPAIWVRSPPEKHPPSDADGARLVSAAAASDALDPLQIRPATAPVRTNLVKDVTAPLNSDHSQCHATARAARCARAGARTIPCAPSR